jgi:hypothetical protein
MLTRAGIALNISFLLSDFKFASADLNSLHKRTFFASSAAATASKEKTDENICGGCCCCTSHLYSIATETRPNCSRNWTHWKIVLTIDRGGLDANLHCRKIRERSKVRLCRGITKPSTTVCTHKACSKSYSAYTRPISTFNGKNCTCANIFCCPTLCIKPGTRAIFYTSTSVLLLSQLLSFFLKFAGI